MKELTLGGRTLHDQDKVSERLAAITSMVFNVHGVLAMDDVTLVGLDEVVLTGTTGTVEIATDRPKLLGTAQIITFSAADKPRLSVALEMGIHCSFISGRMSPALEARAAECKVQQLFSKNKEDGEPLTLAELLSVLGVSAHQVLYVGNDWNDLRFMKGVGVAVMSYTRSGTG